MGHPVQRRPPTRPTEGDEVIRTWTVDPPEPRRHIIHIAKLDMDVFAAPVVAASTLVHDVRMVGSHVFIDPPGTGSRMSYGSSSPYIVTFSDGKVGRCGLTTLRQALEALGQTWEEGR